MGVLVNLYSTEKTEIKRFLDKYYSSENVQISESLKWEREFKNPIEIADIIGVFVDNNDKFKLNMWICLDSDFFLNVTDDNSGKIIRYLFERYPY
ncbi:MAG: hypothetical protein FWC68_02945 [Oscillospiraceae bacterium]|nr:hypothetical protein [Oscillospiraceae bacterium]